MKYLLILMYSNAMTIAEEKLTFAACIQESENRIGEEIKVTMWDDMNGSNPIPKI